MPPDRIHRVTRWPLSRDRGVFMASERIRRSPSQRRTDMGKIVISENASLDGVVQDPTGEEGFRFGGWFGQVGDNDRRAWAQLGVEEAMSAKAVLLGRLSDEWFATRWLSRTGPWAERLNSMPKYSESSTLNTPKW